MEFRGDVLQSGAVCPASKKSTRVILPILKQTDPNTCNSHIVWGEVTLELRGENIQSGYFTDICYLMRTHGLHSNTPKKIFYSGITFFFYLRRSLCFYHLALLSVDLARYSGILTVKTLRQIDESLESHCCTGNHVFVMNTHTDCSLFWLKSTYTKCVLIRC